LFHPKLQTLPFTSMKKYGVFLAAAALGALLLSAAAFGGRMGGGRPAVARRVFNRTGFGHDFRGKGRGGGLAFGQDGRFHGRESDFVGFGFPYPYYPYADEGHPDIEPYSGDGSGPAGAAAYPNDLARRGDYTMPMGSVLSPASSQLQGSGRGSHYAGSSNGPIIAREPQKDVRPEPNKPAALRANPPGANASTLVTASTAAAHGHAFDKLVLVSCLKDAGKDTILVENTETNDVQQITSQPNKDHLRIVEIHVDENPRLTEVVISNGTEQGPVKFRFETPATANPPARPAPLVRGASGQTLMD
jgi:hypothetical protein